MEDVRDVEGFDQQPLPERQPELHLLDPWRYTYGSTAGVSHRIILKLDYLGTGARVLGTQTIAQTCNP